MAVVLVALAVGRVVGQAVLLSLAVGRMAVVLVALAVGRMAVVLVALAVGRVVGQVVLNQSQGEMRI